MDHSNPVVWAKYVVKAGIEYFCERKVRCGILVDNDVLKDGVLSAISEKRNDFIICIAPDFVTQMEFAPMSLDITVNFGNMWHAMQIPYSAILMVVAVGEGRVLSDDGQLNMISVPPTVYPTNANYIRRNKPAVDVAPSTVSMQPPQEELINDANVSLFNRRRSDSGLR